MNHRFLHTALLTLAGALGACGGGGGGSDPVAPAAVATVSSATAAAPASYGQSMLITINGSSLDAGLISVASPGCSSITRSTTSPNVSTPTTAYYACTVSAFGKQTVTVALTSDSSVLRTIDFTVPEAKVTSATAAAPAYGQSMLITINGSDLDAGLSLASPGCSSITRSTTSPNVSTPTTAFYGCTVSAFGAQRLTVARTADSAELAAIDFTVPAPTVASATAAAPTFGQIMLITVNGTSLDAGLDVTSAGCSSITRRTSAPNASTASTAYYDCMVSGFGAQTVTVARAGDSAALATIDFTVPPLPQVPAVSSATAAAPAYGQIMLITINGSNLDAGLNLASAGCSSIALSTTSPNVSTPSTAYYGCTVSGFGAQTVSVARASDGAVLATIPFDVPLVPLVSSATAGTPMYSQALVFTVQGVNLDGDRIDLDATGCDNVTLGTTSPHVSSASVAYYSCTVTQVGAQRATVARASDGAVLATVDFTVPVPQVTLNMSNGVAAGGGLVAGNVVITLAPEEAPITVNNFLAYVNAGFYDATVFHRYAPGFVLQGGGWAAELDPALPVPPRKATNAPIPLEVGVGLSNVRLSVAMARTTVLNSATSQFFFNLVDNVFLDTAAGGYAVFGIITAGAEVIDALPTAPCASYPALLGAGECLPYPNLTVLSARQTR